MPATHAPHGSACVALALHRAHHRCQQCGSRTRSSSTTTAHQQHPPSWSCCADAATPTRTPSTMADDQATPEPAVAAHRGGGASRTGSLAHGSRDAWHGIAGDRSQCAGSGRDLDGRPAGLGQNDDDRQDRLPPDEPGSQESADGVARHAPSRRAGAAPRPRRSRRMSQRSRSSPDKRRSRSRAAPKMRASSAATTSSSTIPPAASLSTKS